MRPAGPLVVDLGEDGADEAQERLGVGEERGNARAPLDFLVKGFEGVRGAEPPSVVAWKHEDGERFGDVRLDPRSKLGRGRLVLLGNDFDPPVRLGAIGPIEDGPQIARDLGSHRELGYVRECVADEMKLAALPRRAGEDGFTELARDSQDGPLAVLAGTGGDEDGAADDGAAVPEPRNGHTLSPNHRGRAAPGLLHNRINQQEKT